MNHVKDTIQIAESLLTREEQATYTVNDLGFVVLKRPANAAVITDEQVNLLRDQEGV